MIGYRLNEDRANEATREIYFGFVDPWNRGMGCRIYTFTTTWSAEENEYAWHPRPREEIEALAVERNKKPYGVSCSQTRDGRSYGAYRAPTFYATEAEREKHIARYLKTAQKNAEKSCAKQAARRAARKAG